MYIVKGLVLILSQRQVFGCWGICQVTKLKITSFNFAWPQKWLPYQKKAPSTDTNSYQFEPLFVMEWVIPLIPSLQPPKKSGCWLSLHHPKSQAKYMRIKGCTRSSSSKCISAFSLSPSWETRGPFSICTATTPPSTYFWGVMTIVEGSQQLGNGRVINFGDSNPCQKRLTWSK